MCLTSGSGDGGGAVNLYLLTCSELLSEGRLGGGKGVGGGGVSGAASYNSPYSCNILLKCVAGPSLMETFVFLVLGAGAVRYAGISTHDSRIPRRTQVGASHWTVTGHSVPVVSSQNVLGQSEHSGMLRKIPLWIT